jgi:predicted membrane channel-forming protein YqfA (hemolysin III family)
MIVEHLVGLLCWIAIVVCPIPLCLSLFLTADLEENSPNFTHSLLLVLTGWCALEAVIGLLSGIILQSFTLSTVLTLNLLLFSLGVVFFVARQPSSLLVFIGSIKPDTAFFDLVRYSSSNA